MNTVITPAITVRPITVASSLATGEPDAPPRVDGSGPPSTLSSPNAPSAGGRAGRHVVGLAVVALVTLLGAANLADVYGSFMLWAYGAVPATLIGCAVAAAGRHATLRVWWQLAGLAVAQCLLGPVLTLNGTAIAHVLPSAATLREGCRAIFGAFTRLLALDPPVGATDGSLMAVWTICLWGSFLAGSCAIADAAIRAPLAAVPLAGVAALSALLGTGSGFHRPISGVIGTLALVLWLSWRMHTGQAGRWPTASVLLCAACVAAIMACLALAPHRFVLREHYEPPISPYEYASPLSGMRAYLKKHRDDTLLTVTGLPEGTPVRLAVMDDFDGTVWNLSDARRATGGTGYRRAGATLEPEPSGQRFTATFTPGDALDGDWLPLAGTPITVAATDADASGRIYYNAGTRSALVDGGVAGMRAYTETGVIKQIPSDAEVERATAGNLTQPPAIDVPATVARTATAIAGSDNGTGRAARMLASTLADTGWFSHGLAGDHPSPPGHGSHRVNALLDGTAMIGDSEQYASAMALMARELGLPSRVVLGFTPKDTNGQASAARTIRRADGTSRIEFTGNDLEAWVEVNLRDHGWVAFHPTPQETKTPDQDQRTTPPDPDPLVRQPPVPLSDPLHDDTPQHAHSVITGRRADPPPPASPWDRISRIAIMIAWYGAPVWALLLAIALILLYKAAVLAYRRRHGPPAQRIAAGWQTVCALASQIGVTARGTRQEQAQTIAMRLHADTAALLALARNADHATFSGQPVSDGEATRFWRAVAQVRRAMLDSQPRARRWRAMLSLHAMRPFHAVPASYGTPGMPGQPTSAGPRAAVRRSTRGTGHRYRTCRAHRPPSPSTPCRRSRCTRQNRGRQ